MRKQSSSPQSVAFSDEPSPFPVECWFDDVSILDMDYFVKTLSEFKSKGVRSQLIGSIITHYASKWLPELFVDELEKGLLSFKNSPGSATASWMKKRFLVETLVGVLPLENDAVPCDFLLRLLRVANLVAADATYRIELERRASSQLDQASLKEVMIPSFSHTCGTLLDVELMLRLVRMFVGQDGEAGGRSGAATMKVARLVDCYLAEAALDSSMSVSEFADLAGTLPSHARVSDDGLYRAVDTYLKTHSGVSKAERKALCRLIDSRKLSPEASIHAAQNDRLPVRAVIRVLFSEQMKLTQQQIEWSGSFNGGSGGGARSPKPTCSSGTDQQIGRCQSKREMASQQAEIRKLREEVTRLRSQCASMQWQIERLTEKKKLGFFSWRKLGMGSSIKTVASVGNNNSKKMMEDQMEDGREMSFGKLTVMGMKKKTATSSLAAGIGRTGTPNKWRRSMS